LKSKRWLISFMAWFTAFVTSAMSIFETMSNEFSAAIVNLRLMNDSGCTIHDA